MAKFSNLVKIQDKLLNDLLLNFAQNRNDLYRNDLQKQSLQQELNSLGLTEQLGSIKALLQLKKMREYITARMQENEAKKQDLLKVIQKLQKDIKQANLKLEQYKYLVDEELKAKKLKQEKLEQKNLDEIAIIQFNNKL